MTGAAKRKGDSAEREAASLLSEALGVAVRRKLGAGRADDEGDLDIPSATVQIKNYADTLRAINETMKELPVQQANAGTPFGFGMIRRRGGQWLVIMNVEQLAALWRKGEP